MTRMAIGLRSVAGFTMIEMLIVIAIIGTMVSIAVPNYIVWNQKYQLKEAVGTLHGTIGLARMIATNQNKTVTVTVCHQTDPCPLVPVATPNPTSKQVTVFFQSGGIDVIPKMTMVPGIALTKVDGSIVGGGIASPQDVQFTPMGRPAPFTSTPGGILGNNLCINAAGVGVASCADGATVAQALNFKNSNGLNYRIVITSTGKAAWGYSPTLAP
jgi:prepilin-type N-terminal cleavage/methylation domain-containing protein